MGFLHANWAKLVKHATPAERAIEPYIASLGVPYRTQHPLFLWHGSALPFFPDFVLLRERVIIEIDDPGHAVKARVAKDALRSERLRAAGYVVVRMTNDDALRFPVASLNRCLRQAGLSLTCQPP